MFVWCRMEGMTGSEPIDDTIGLYGSGLTFAWCCRLSAPDGPTGYRCSDVVPGWLPSWHMTLTGDWWARVRLDVANANGRARLQQSP